MKKIYIVFFLSKILLTFFDLNKDLKSYSQICNEKLGKLKRKFYQQNIAYSNKYYQSVITNRGDLLAPIFGDMKISIVRQKITPDNYDKILRFLNVWHNEGDNKYFIPKLYQCEYSVDQNNQIEYLYYSQSAIQEDVTYKLTAQTQQGIRFKQQYFPVRYRKYRDMYLALRELHNQGLVHGNITPECIVSSEPLNVKDINYYTEYEWDFYISGYRFIKNVGEAMETQNIYYWHPEMKVDNSARPEYDIYMLSLSILVIESYRINERDDSYIFKDLDPYADDYFEKLIVKIEDLFLIQMKLKTNEGTIQDFSECRNLSCLMYYSFYRDLSKIPTAEQFRRSINEFIIIHDASHELKRIMKLQAKITKDNDDLEDLDLDDTDPFNITMFIEHKNIKKVL